MQKRPGHSPSDYIILRIEATRVKSPTPDPSDKSARDTNQAGVRDLPKNIFTEIVLHNIETKVI